MTHKRILTGFALLIISAGVALGALLLRTQPSTLERSWNEARWSMPRDQWGEGVAFQCGASGCGGKIVIHVRAKLGFCDCNQGIIDDDHLDRIGDADLMGGSQPIAVGKVVAVRWMHGRMRRYAGTTASASVLSIAISDRCDVIVATAVLPGHLDSALEQAQEKAVLRLLNGATVLDWAERTLGL